MAAGGWGIPRRGPVLDNAASGGMRQATGGPQPFPCPFLGVCAWLQFHLHGTCTRRRTAQAVPVRHLGGVVTGADSMRFGILGPLAAERDGRPLDVGRYKQRALLIALLVEANDVVPVDRLLEWLWPGEHAPAAAATLHSYVSRLRRVLEPERAPRAVASLLVTRAPGYLLRVDPEQVDALRFERLAEQGQLALERGDPGQASVLLREALGLWRGRALADVVFEEAARSAVTRLETLRLGA